MDEAVRLRILTEASELFNSKGYRGVTLSELASRLGMSKKTLYLHFGSKEEIAEAVLQRKMNAIAHKVAEMTSRNGDPIQIFEESFMGIKQEIIKLNPLFLEDVQKYLPRLWEKAAAFRAKQLTFIEKLLVKAQQAGKIQEINTRLLAVLMTESIQQFARPDFAAKHGVSMFEIAETLFMLFVESIRMDRNPNPNLHSKPEAENSQ